MSELAAVRCRACGGAVVARATAPLPTCLFCGGIASDLVPYEPPEDVEPPEGALPFVCTEEDARQAFRTFARSSFWYPSDLRSASLDLRMLHLPAWAWSGELESHWTGLVRASTRSGKRPVAGAESRHFEQVLVPASPSLTIAELAALGAFDESSLVAFHPSRAEIPYELSEMTRSAARQAAQREMSRRHRAHLEASHALVKSRLSSVCLSMQGRPVLVPVFIGAYRYGDQVYRVLVNGQSGELQGSAPISLWKVAFAVLAAAAALAGFALFVLSCTGALAALGLM